MINSFEKINNSINIYVNNHWLFITITIYIVVMVIAWLMVAEKYEYYWGDAEHWAKIGAVFWPIAIIFIIGKGIVIGIFEFILAILSVTIYKL